MFTIGRLGGDLGREQIHTVVRDRTYPLRLQYPGSRAVNIRHCCVIRNQRWAYIRKAIRRMCTFQRIKLVQSSNARGVCRSRTIRSNLSRAVSMSMSSITGNGTWFTSLRHIAGSNEPAADEPGGGREGPGRARIRDRASLHDAMRYRHRAVSERGG